MKRLAVIFAVTLGFSLAGCTYLINNKNESFEMTVDYSLSFEDALLAGHYDGVGGMAYLKQMYLTESKSGKVKDNFALLAFGREMKTEKVLAFMKKNNLRPATLKELLAFGADAPEEQRAFWVVELASFNGDCPAILMSGWGRYAAFRPDMPVTNPGTKWPKGARFLVVVQK